MIKPITPIKASKKDALPDGILRAFNRLLSEKYSNGLIRITQKEAVKVVLEELENDDIVLTSNELFARGWMDIEPLYRRAGWTVDYDKMTNLDTMKAMSPSSSSQNRHESQSFWDVAEDLLRHGLLLDKCTAP